ncbi:MAG: ribosome maturation factor RimP [Woeseiaceae bacterium]|jgi:ribosome maturation factor RimP|tara:strand:+ start:42 stop:503 length:462 start_codon:yes stop_codon:yes gene_type:complete
MDFNDLKLLIEPTVNKIGYELTDLEMKWNGENNLIRLFIDRPEGIGLEDCETVSQQVGMLMDIEEPIKDDYVLEVSSPGLDRRLTKTEHYLKFLGDEVRVKLTIPQDGRRNFKGNLLTANEDFIEVKVDGEVYKISIDTIDFTRLVPVFKNKK